MSLWLGPRERKGGVQRGMRVRHHEAAPELYGHITHAGFSMFGLHPQTKMGVYLCLLKSVCYTTHMRLITSLVPVAFGEERSRPGGKVICWVTTGIHCR